MLMRWCTSRDLHNIFISGRLRYIRQFSASHLCHNVPPVQQPSRTRNIGIIAHIDAGKTTTTERMLYYSGLTRRLGDVDEGSTVTDFLPAERARGITIQSAAVTFTWPPSQKRETSAVRGATARLSSNPHSINLIDTPGHADFTFEVLRSLRILDGAVCILDGVAGVEAQTEQVWKQADFYQIPRLLFVNKLDREGAAFARTVKEVGSRLRVWPAVCQIPWWTGKDGRLEGVGDVLGLKALRYPEGGDGKVVEAIPLRELKGMNSSFAAELCKARIALVELLSEHDDDLVEEFLEQNEDHLAVSEQFIVRSLRKVTLQSPQTVAPLFAGASFKNIGVQPLLDAVVDMLPAPEERPDPNATLDAAEIHLNKFLSGKELPATDAAKGNKLMSKTKGKTSFALKNIETCALAFKVVNDAKRGVLVYVRVYSGEIVRTSQLFNTNLGVTERTQRLLRMYANDAVDVQTIPTGQIGVLPGLKFTRTGDTLISYLGANPKHGPPAPLNTLQLRPIAVPPPVFFASVEPNSLSEEKNVHDQLALLLREDPSLNVTQDPDSGQTHLAGMGELHLEIARDHLINDLKAKAQIGSIRIGYREALVQESEAVRATFNREIAGKAATASCTAIVAPVQESGRSAGPWSTTLLDNNTLHVSIPGILPDGTPESDDIPVLPDALDVSTVRSAIQSGVSAAVACGPSHSYPLHSTAVQITLSIGTDVTPTTVPAALSSAARLATTAALRDAAKRSATALMEPVMLATISVDEPSLGGVVHDLSSARGAQIVSLDADADGTSMEDAEGADRPVIDVKRIYAPPDPFASGSDGQAGNAFGHGRTRQIVARVPLKEMVGYLKHLRSLTAGRGTFTMKVDSFEKMSAQRQKVALGEMRGGFD